LIVDLQKAAEPLTKVKQATSIESYFRLAEEFHKQVQAYLNIGDFRRAYVVLFKFAELVTAISKHKDYSKSKYTSKRKIHRSRLENAIHVLEVVLPQRLQALLELERAEEAEAIRRKFEEKLMVTPGSVPIPVQKKVSEDVKEMIDEVPKTETSVVETTERWKNLLIPEFSTPIVSPHKPLTMLQKVVVPIDLMDSFLAIAFANTKKDIETCGILCGTISGGMITINTVGLTCCLCLDSPQ